MTAIYTILFIFQLVQVGSALACCSSTWFPYWSNFCLFRKELTQWWGTGMHIYITLTYRPTFWTPIRYEVYIHSTVQKSLVFSPKNGFKPGNYIYCSMSLGSLHFQTLILMIPVRFLYAQGVWQQPVMIHTQIWSHHHQVSLWL